MRIGVMIEGQEGITWDNWFHIIEVADRLGYDSVWRSDHIFSGMTHGERETLALWPSLTAVPFKSDRLEFGQLVSPTTFRDPVMLAKDAVALDRLSDGRYWLGVGAGWNEVEHRAFGFELPALKDRMDRLEEALDVITLLWTGELVNYHGRFFTLENARMRPKPLEQSGVPLVIGGSGEKRLLNLVARFADEWNATVMTPERYAHKVQVLEQHCEEVGRDPQTIARSLMLGHIVGRDQQELEQRAAWLGSFLPGLKDRSPQEILQGRRDGGWLVGTPDQAVRQLEELSQLGISRVMIQTFNTEDDDELALIADEVMPKVAQD